MPLHLCASHAIHAMLVRWLDAIVAKRAVHVRTAIFCRAFSTAGAMLIAGIDAAAALRTEMIALGSW